MRITDPPDLQARLQLEIAKRHQDLDRIVGMYAQTLVSLMILELQQRSLEEQHAEA